MDNQGGNQGVVARDLTPEGLLELRLAALAAELNPGMTAKFPGNLHRQQAELNEKLRAAHLQFPIRETAEKEFKAAAKKTKNLITRLKKMGAVEKIPAVDIAAGVREMDRWEKDLKACCCPGASGGRLLRPRGR